MKKIVILGCENSHADSFLALIREKEEFQNVSVIGVYSNEPEAAERLHERFGVPVMERYDDAVGKVDGVVITARHGDLHYKYAKPYIADGVPMFIDKPITIREDEVIEFMRALMENGVRVSGGSSLKHDPSVMLLKKEREESLDGATLSGFVRAPIDTSEVKYGGFYFYAQHMVEMVCEIFGRFPLSVTAKQNGAQIHVLFHYDEYDCVGLFTDKCYRYFVSRMAQRGEHAISVPTEDIPKWFYGEFKEYHDLLMGNEQTATYAALASPVFILNAIWRSLGSGKEEAVGRLPL